MTKSNTTKTNPAAKNNYFIPLVLILVSVIVILATFYKQEELSDAKATTMSSTETSTNKTDLITNPAKKIQTAQDSEPAIITGTDNNNAKASENNDIATDNTKTVKIAAQVKQPQKVKKVIEPETTNKTAEENQAPLTLAEAKTSTTDVSQASVSQNTTPPNQVSAIPGSVTARNQTPKGGRNGEAMKNTTDNTKTDMNHRIDEPTTASQWSRAAMARTMQRRAFFSHQSPPGFPHPAENGAPFGPGMHPMPSYPPFMPPAHRYNRQFNPRFKPDNNTEFQPAFNPGFNQGRHAAMHNNQRPYRPATQPRPYQPAFMSMPTRPAYPPVSAPSGKQHDEMMQTSRKKMQLRHKAMEQAMKQSNDRRVKRELQQQANHLEQIRKLQQRALQHAQMDRRMMIKQMQKMDRRFKHLEKEFFEYQQKVKSGHNALPANSQHMPAHNAEQAHESTGK